MRHFHLIVKLAVIAFTIAGAILVGSEWDASVTGVSVGLTLIIVAAIALAACLISRYMHDRIKPLDDLYEEGYAVGHGRGYWEGRHQARPAIVHLSCPNCGHELPAGQRRRPTS